MNVQRMSLLGLVFVIAVAGVLVSPMGGTVAEAQALRLKFGHNSEETHPTHLGAKRFAAAVEERTKGQIKIDVFPSNILGAPPEVTEQVRLGVTDMYMPTSGQLDKWAKAFGAVMLPFVYDDYDHAHRVMDGPSFQWYSQMAEKEGFILLSNWEYGFRHILNNKRPINSPADVKGLKLRVPPEIQLQAAFEAMGAVTTVIAFPEVYMALAQGAVDGVENPLSILYFSKFYEVQKYLAITRHVYNTQIQVISTKTWAKLTPEQKAIFQEESKKASTFVRQQLNSQEEELISKMEKAGVQVTRPNLAPFREAMAPAYERIGKYAGEENVKKFREFIEAARKK